MPPTKPDVDYLYKLRHSTTHVMAQAVQELFPGTKLTIGPPIEDGFYYDFDSPHRFAPEDLEKIEARMREISAGNHQFVMSAHSSDEARRFWGERGENYKVEIIDDLNEPTVTYCSHGAFTDLCRGNHLESTRDIRHFKLLKVAGAYWRGDEKRAQLQRIYGTAWPTKEELEGYLARLEEAKKRDHRDLGQKLDLFSIQHETAGPGLVFWHPKGTVIRTQIENLLKDTLSREGYDFVVTPHVARLDLWKTSGHWDYYRQNMFTPMEIENQPFVVKPMNCPGHILIYKSRLHSYRELPLRYAEFGTVYRYERSGVMHGLLRVRGFTQDDAHIFCRMDQMEEECSNLLRLTLQVLKIFGFNDVRIMLSTRPERFSGTPEGWDLAEGALRNALKSQGLSYEVDPGEGVFYGPKVDLKIRDSLNREWQCSTIQVDFNLPQKFDVTYRDASSRDSHCVMIHRALLGSLERFIGILIEHYGGAFPVWLAPVQAKVLTITDKQSDYAASVARELRSAGFRAEVDDRPEKINSKVREAAMARIPYLLVAGGREAESRSVSVRGRDGANLGPMPLGAFMEKLGREAAEKIDNLSSIS
ncbi:MAG: threonine--tRNA ligase [Elusimicrobia bacterium RIFCSPLOWO2_01_FULL_64_13]|nr:MAG: threonine--tRNA ligase [Elusimicrobia bacterium RIFCSPLOWO2_01_FULL_64_13]